MKTFWGDFEFKDPQIWRDFEAQFSERDEFRKALKLPTTK